MYSHESYFFWFDYIQFLCVSVYVCVYAYVCEINTNYICNNISILTAYYH